MRGYTVEMSFLMPMILLLIMSSIFGVFYYHDKNIISGAAYEAVAVGSTKAREKGGADESEVEAVFRERLENKCILFGRIIVSAAVRENEVEITGTASKRGMKVSVTKRMRITEPERKIRDIRRMKKLGDGTKNNH